MPSPAVCVTSNEPQDEVNAVAGSSAGMSGMPVSVSVWIDAVAAAVPSRVAVEDEFDCLTYGQLTEQVDSMARHIGCLPGEFVAVALPRSCDLIITLLAILKANKAYVPIDPASPAARAGLITSQFDDLSLITTGDLLATVPAARRVDVGELKHARPAMSHLPVGDPRRLAYVMFTSGSTGQPKGVQVSHGNLMSFIQATEKLHDWSADDASCLFHSYAFDFSVWEIFGALLHGARLVVPSWRTTRSPADFLTFIRNRRVTVLSQTPSAFSQLLRTLTPYDVPRLALRQLILGGEALRFSLLRRWFALVGERVKVFNIYGPTETTVWVTCHRIYSEDALVESDSVLGHPLDGVTLHLLDEHGTRVPNGHIGEIVIHGPTVSNGYLGQPDLAVQGFVDGPHVGQRRYHTGDLGFVRADGNLVYIGRRDAQVQIQGHRVELGEIEAALARIEGVDDCVVRLDDSDPTRARLVGYLVGRPKLDDIELRRQLRKLLPPYMVPEVFIRLDALPLTINGKLDVDALPTPPVVTVAPASDNETVARRVRRVWEQVVGVTGIGEEDNFFDVGGTSLHVIDVHSRLVHAFDAPELSMVDLFEYSTPAAMAMRIEECHRIRRVSINPEPCSMAM